MPEGKKRDIPAPGIRIRELRLEKGMTPEEFAKKTGLTRSDIYNLEAGSHACTESYAKRIEKAFGINWEWILLGEQKRIYHPVDEKISNWLWNHEDIRKSIWIATLHDENLF